MNITYVIQRGEPDKPIPVKIHDRAKEVFEQYPKIETVVISYKAPTKNGFKYETRSGSMEGRSVYAYLHQKTKKLSRVKPPSDRELFAEPN